MAHLQHQHFNPLDPKPHVLQRASSHPSEPLKMGKPRKRLDDFLRLNPAFVKGFTAKLKEE